MPLFTFMIISILVFLAIAMPFVFARRINSGQTIERRELPALDELNSALARASETGLPIHLSPGAGSLHGSTINPETFAGLVLAKQVTRIATNRGARVSASSGDAISHLALRGIVRSTYRNAGSSQDYDPDLIHLYADHDAMAFAAGMGNRLVSEPMDASISIGSFGDSYLLFGEQARQHGVHQVVGTADQSSLVGAILTAEGTLIGEEMYAAETYTNPAPLSMVRLLTHDTLRWVLIAFLFIGIILLTLVDYGIVPANFPLLPK